MIGVSLTASRAAIVIRELIEEHMSQIRDAATKNAIPDSKLQYWGWLQRQERKLAVLELAEAHFLQMPPTTIVMEGEAAASRLEEFK